MTLRTCMFACMLACATAQTVPPLPDPTPVPTPVPVPTPTPAPVDNQPAGSWQNVTPSTISLDPNLNPAGNYGVNGLVADPMHPGTFYATVDYQGVWASHDYGLTWTKVSIGAGGNALDNGRPWTLAIAPDGSYLMTCLGYPVNGFQLGAYKSTDGGVSWTRYSLPGNGSDITVIRISPYNKNHVVAGPHWNGDNHLYESDDSGVTWADRGPIGGATGGVTISFLFDDSTLLGVSDGDTGAGGGTWRGTRSGTTWTWTHVSKQQKNHGGHKLWIDWASNTIYNPGAFGIMASADGGLTWGGDVPVNAKDPVNGILQASNVLGTSTTIYAGSSYASETGFPPSLEHASRSGGAWAADSKPAAMTNGPDAWDAAQRPDGKWVIVSANWLGGIWRFVEGP